MLTPMEPEFAGLPTFDPFSNENASQVGTNPCFGSKDLPANSGSIGVSIFSSSCNGFAGFACKSLAQDPFCGIVEFAGRFFKGCLIWSVFDGLVWWDKVFQGWGK